MRPPRIATKTPRPKQLHCGIVGHQRYALDNRLRREHPIERVSVILGETVGENDLRPACA